MVNPQADLGIRLRELHTATRTRARALDAAIAQLRRDRGADVADDEHDPEGVTLSAEWAHLAGLRRAVAQELADLDEAGSRWDAGAYGVCVDCGRGIPIERLRARPAAARCVSCAEKAGG
ncbi:TraR/DksA family transcriptional regulator [Microbacterium deminutum]|uniref:Zinc finger DksA/TraR C4-type domain-containing protein n=1 Tax=Microbacterium deminutum TaxID=344164 RepID=A0ABN2QCD7_9MICO